MGMGKSHPVSVRLDKDTLEQVRELSQRTDRTVGQILSTLVNEGVRMRRCPGIVFADGPTGRRATVAGSGIDVWEVIRVLKTCKDRRRLARALPQLSPRQLDAALAYYTCYPDEIDRRIEQNAVPLPTLQRRSPFIKKVRV